MVLEAVSMLQWAGEVGDGLGGRGSSWLRYSWLLCLHLAGSLGTARTKSVTRVLPP